MILRLDVANIYQELELFVKQKLNKTLKRLWNCFWKDYNVNIVWNLISLSTLYLLFFWFWNFY